MKTERLNYYIPVELIAQQPADVRSNSKLLVLNRCGDKLLDSRFDRIGDFLSAGDCLVVNDTKVLAARFFAARRTGSKLEGLFISETTPGVWEVMLKGARKVKTGEIINLKDHAGADFCTARILDKPAGDTCRLEIETDTTLLEKIGFAPLPPYIKRNTDLRQAASDKLRYQTVYARKAGAIAAPTAGLHLTNPLIEQLKGNGVEFAYITLHVGLGTFKPVTAENLDEHEIHQERFSIDLDNAQIINAAKKKGRRIIAVGTTSVRTLETATIGSQVEPVSGTTDLFIKPGYEFKMVDAIVTNFHLPKSTLLALVAAFAGLENVLAAYNHAVQQRYRFYSYGDAMLIV